MNENIQQILYYGVAFLCGVITTIIGIFLYNRSSDGATGIGIKNAKRINSEIGYTKDRITDTVTNVRKTVDGLDESTSGLKQSTERVSEILEEVRSQKLD